MEPIDKQVLPVWKLLSIKHLRIPDYQRPYRWGSKNIVDLFTDINTNLQKNRYRLGTVVLHYHKESGTDSFDIVDGQQRTVTMMLAVRALIACRLKELKRLDLQQLLEGLKQEPANNFMNWRFPSQHSEINLRRNYMDLKRLVSRPDFHEDQIDFLLNRCEVVTIVLNDVSEAFQFFDSQNSRGRDLAPHDLLKAFHLREFAEHEKELQANSVAHWEESNSEDLSALFSNYLYRVRRWAEGRSARVFGKGDVDLFKGVNLDKIGQLPYAEHLRILHHFVDDYNGQHQRKIDRHKMQFPFRLDQTVINGRRFFEMVTHYLQQFKVVNDTEFTGDDGRPVTILGMELDGQASKIIRTINSYKKRNRTGDRYVRALFNCSLLFYLDKFGTQKLSAAIEKCFIWTYRCRISKAAVQWATVDRYVLEHNLIRAIRDARQPEDLLSFQLATLNHRHCPDPAAGDELVALFKEMNYYE